MGNCFYCESPMYRPGRVRANDFLARAGFGPAQRGRNRFLHDSRDTKEHLKRRADGGVGLDGNTVRACAWCNSNRGEATVEDHKAAMMTLKARGEHPVACHYEQTVSGK